MAQVIERCRTCGFDIPVDEEACPSCGPVASPSLPTRQLTGSALPTRSVHPLPGVAPRREHEVPPMGPARTARSAFSFTTALALITFATAGLAWLVNQPQVMFSVPDSTAAVLDDLTTMSATASIAALLIGLLAMVVWCVRATGRSVRRRVSR